MRRRLPVRDELRPGLSTRVQSGCREVNSKKKTSQKKKVKI